MSRRFACFFLRFVSWRNKRGFFRPLTGVMVPMHAKEATVGADSRMAVAADDLEIMLLGENTDGVAETSVSTVTLEGMPRSRHVAKVWLGDRGCELLVKEASG